MSDQNFQQIILLELENILSPVLEAANSEKKKKALFAELGWQYDELAASGITGSIDAIITTFDTDFTQLTNLVNNPPNDLQGIATAFQTVDGLLTTIDGLSSISYNGGSLYQFNEITKDLINLLVTSYLESLIFLQHLIEVTN